MIVCALGYGYLAKFVFQRICLLGIRGVGITSKQINHNGFENITIVDRDKIKEALAYSTHLLVTVPPDELGCPIINKFSNHILNSNIKSTIYISSTGVYGNHKGNWIDENSPLKAKSQLDKMRVKSERQWKRFCIKNNLNFNVVRISGLYGPERIVKLDKKKLQVVVKKNHFFSRIHILDASRLVSKIILKNYKNQVWNVADDLPSSRELFLSEVIRIKNFKNFSTIAFDKYKKTISEKSKKFWLNNKRVSNRKVKKYFEYRFIFPNYKDGIRSLKDYI